MSSQERAVPDGPALQRGFSFWSAFGIAFAIVSPIIAVYSVLGFAIADGGPGAWWTFLVALLGSLAIGLVLGQLASRWPYEGSIYQWARRLGGPAYGWFAGWAYMATYSVASAAICYGVVAFIPPAIGIASFDKGTKLIVAFALVLLATLANTTGRRWLKLLVLASITAEVVGSVGVGTVLMFFHHQQPLSSIVDYHGKGISGGTGIAGMLAALAFVGWAFNGFESAGAIGEEVENPTRNIPKAILLVIVLIGAIALYSSLAIILAIPDVGAVLAGKYDDPVTATIVAALGNGASHPLFAGFVISFFAGLVAAQTAVSRVMWAYARDDVLPGSKALVQLSGDDQLPVRAILATTAVISLLLLVGLSDNVFATLITFTTGGFFIAFSFAVLGYLRLKLSGRWEPGPFTLSRSAVPVAIVAALWCILEFVNVAWPRGGLPWFESWGVLLMTLLFGVLGLLVFLSVRTRVAGSWSAEPSAEGVAVAADLEPA
jgi:amino acid transporter